MFHNENLNVPLRFDDDEGKLLPVCESCGKNAVIGEEVTAIGAGWTFSCPCTEGSTFSIAKSELTRYGALRLPEGFIEQLT